MQESRITLTKEMGDQLWQGYRCAACLEPQDEAFPVRCRAVWCGFPIRAEQRRRLGEDFVGEVERVAQESLIDREQAFLEEHFHVRRPH